MQLRISKDGSNLIIYLMGALLLRGINYLTTPILTRIMTQEEYGVLSIFITWTTIFAIFIGAQVSGTIPSATTKYKEEGMGEYLHNCVIISFTVFFLFFVLGIILKKQIAGVLQLDDVILVPSVFFVAFGKSMANLYSAYTIQNKQAKNNMIFSLSVASASFLLGVLWTVQLRKDCYWGKIFAEIIIYIVVILFVVCKFGRFKKNSIKREYWKYAFTISIPLIIHLLSTNIISQSDRIFITAMLGYRENAIYSVAYSIGMLGVIAVEVGFNVWTPWFFEQIGHENYGQINKRFQMFVLVVDAIFLGVILMAPEVFWVMAPEEYKGGQGCVIIIGMAMLCNFMYRFPLCYEQYCGKMQWVARATTIATIVNLILNYILIGYMGLEGAAVATLIATLCLWIIHEIVVRKVLRDYPINTIYGLPVTIVVLIVSVVMLCFNPCLEIRGLFLAGNYVICGMILFKIKRADGES